MKFLMLLALMMSPVLVGLAISAIMSPHIVFGENNPFRRKP